MSASAPSDERAVITGLGVVAPTGIGTDAWWQATLAGTSGIGRITRFDPSKYATQLAGEVSDFEATDFIDNRLIAQTDRWTWMALAAAQMALDDAKVDPAGARSVQDERHHRERVRRQRVRPEGDPEPVGQGPDLRRRLPVDRLVLRRDHGPDLDQVRDEGAVRRARLRGRRRPRGALALAADDPARRRRRRQRRHRGAGRPVRAHVPAAELPAERGRRAGATRTGRSTAARTATCPARAARSSSSREPSTPSSEARRRSTARSSATPPRTTPRIRSARRRTAATSRARSSLAIERAGVGPDDIDAVFADASGVPEADRAEAEAIKSVFGGRSVPVTAPKSMTGRLYAGGAPLDVAAALLAMRDGVLPPTINLDEPAEGCDLDFVTGEKRDREARAGARERTRLRRLQQRDGARTQLELTLDDLLRESALRHADRPALAWSGERALLQRARRGGRRPRGTHPGCSGGRARTPGRADRAEHARTRARPLRDLAPRGDRRPAERAPARARAARDPGRRRARRCSCRSSRTRGTRSASWRRSSHPACRACARASSSTRAAGSRSRSDLVLKQHKVLGRPRTPPRSSTPPARRAGRRAPPSRTGASWTAPSTWAACCS